MAARPICEAVGMARSVRSPDRPQGGVDPLVVSGLVGACDRRVNGVVVHAR